MVDRLVPGERVMLSPRGYSVKSVGCLREIRGRKIYTVQAVDVLEDRVLHIANCRCLICKGECSGVTESGEIPAIVLNELDDHPYPESYFVPASQVLASEQRK